MANSTRTSRTRDLYRESESSHREVEFGTLSEQKDEAHYDCREDADDDLEKGRIKFPKKLYGRDKEVQQLKEIFASLSGSDGENSTTRSHSRVVFLAGYSGMGKSALVEEFTTQLLELEGKSTRYISGKFGQLNHRDPFSAITEALNQYVRRLIHDKTVSSKQLHRLHRRFAKVDISVGSYDAILLTETLIPDLPDLLEKMEKAASLSLRESTVREDEQLDFASNIDEEKPRPPSQRQKTRFVLPNESTGEVEGFTRGGRNQCWRQSVRYSSQLESLGLSCRLQSISQGGHRSSVIQTVRPDLNLKYVFKNFIRALATSDDPVTMFVDDVQWADDASLQLMASLIQDKSVRHVLFIGGYRLNEVTPDHNWTKIMQEMEQDASATYMEISNLSPNDISQFIADSIDRNVEDVALLSEAIYSKTLGNIFFVKQALEELVRKNALYYDVMCFQWLFGDVTRVELENFLSENAIEMVLKKLQSLPETLQKALALAAFTNPIFDLRLLDALLKAQNVTVESSLEALIKVAFVEGLVLHHRRSLAAGGGGDCYKFAHDRIQEAACASIPVGSERDQCLLRISEVLLQRASSDKDDWMLFTATSHMNSLPSNLVDSMELAELNLTAGKMGASKGAFSEAAVYFRAGVKRCLDHSSTVWISNYSLCLDLHDCLVEAEHFLGNSEKVLAISQEIFDHARTLPDKSRAQFCYIEAYNKTNNMNYGKSADLAVDILRAYGLNVPSHPTSLQVKLEKAKFMVSLCGRSVMCLAEFPVATDSSFVPMSKIVVTTMMYALMGGRPRLGGMLGFRMLRESLCSKVITKDLPLVFGVLAANLRREENYKGAVAYANAGVALLKRFPEERDIEFLKAKMSIYIIIGLRVPFRDGIDLSLELNKLLFAQGESMYSVGLAMCAMFGYINASLRLNTIYESKLLFFEAQANQVGRITVATLFGLIRQCMYNLQGTSQASANPLEVKGPAFDEEAVQATLEGDAQRMNGRDIGMMRIMLAVVFGDEDGMKQMLDRLDEFPIYDIPIERQCLRMSFMGFAALIVSKKCKKYEKWAKNSMSFFEKLSRFGSAHGQPVYACMKALHKPCVAAFEDAIRMCGDEGLFHYAALMNERAGLMLMAEGQNSIEAEKFFINSIWLYHEWGALGKVKQLQSQYKFLHSAMEQKAPSHLSALQRKQALLLASATCNGDILSEPHSAL